MSHHKTSKKLFNPKSHAPAAFIPCWLLQVSISFITPGSKLLYGRLSQWSNATGKVYRSTYQLSQELGTSTRQIERQISELKKLGLIGTFHPQAGGINHFEFYEHDWMFEEINDNLVYKSDPPPSMSVPPDIHGGTLPTYKADINIKEIKEIKDLISIPDSSKSGKNKIKDYQKDKRFMRFYSAYPRKEDPRDAWKAFKSIVGDDDVLLNQILNDLEIRKTTHSQWQDKQFIKYPAVYLRKGEYLGEIFNSQEELKAKKELERIENEKRKTAQEEFSKKRADEIRKNDESKQNDASIYRKITKQVKNISESAYDGLKNLRREVGLN